jgi:DNA-binding response OmpR family regulator
MSGIELAQSLQVMNPHLRVLLMSGSEGAEVVDGLAPETSEFLAKPFRPSELVDRILTILS